MILFCFFIRFLLCQKQINREQNDCGQCGEENVLIRDEGFRSVVVDDFFSTGENENADIGTDDAGDEYLRENTNALELSRLSDGCQIADLCTENSHACEISAHHQQRTDENERRGAEEKEDYIADGKPCEADGNREGEALAVVYLAPKHRDDRSEHDGGCHDENVTGHAERNLIIENEIGHEDLYGNIEDDEGKEINIQRGIFFDRGRQEAVHHRWEISVFFRFELRLVDHEEADNADTDDHDADNGENTSPARRKIEVEKHESAKNRKDRYERHHGIDAFGSAAVSGIRAVGQPCVEGGIVCAGAKEGHHAVKNDDTGNADGGCGSGKRESGFDQIFLEKHEAQNGNAPKNITGTNKDLSFAYLIGKRADQNRCQRCRDRTGGDHGRNILGRGMKHFVDEYVEIHILNDPCDLADQTEER